MNILITIKYESTLFITLTVTFKLIYCDFNILFYTDWFESNGTQTFILFFVSL